METMVPVNLGVMHGDLAEYFQVTGEVVAPKTIKNARNYAAGALNLKDIEEFKERDLHFIAYGITPSQTTEWSDDLDLLRDYADLIQSWIVIGQNIPMMVLYLE